jgi:hypothetical protein
MKKNLIFMLALSFVLCSVFLGMGIVSAEEVNVTITNTTTLTVTNPSITCGDVEAGATDHACTSGDITINVTGSNVNVTVTTTVSNVVPFKTGLKLETVVADTNHYDFVCTLADSICSYTAQTGLTPTLTTPAGLVAGFISATITYTATETPPA